MIKLLFRLVLFVILLVVGVVLGRNFIVRKAVEIGVTHKTGFPLTVGSANLNLLTGKLELRNVKLMNPSEFPDNRFIDFSLLQVDYDTLSMTGDRVHVREMVVRIDELVVVKNAKGEANYEKLKAKLSGGNDKPSPATSGSAAPVEKKKSYCVDLLRVYMGTVVYKDCSKAKPTERKVKLNNEVTYKNVTDATSMSDLIMKIVFDQASGTVNNLLKNIGSFADQVQKIGKSVSEFFKAK